MNETYRKTFSNLSKKLAAALSASFTFSCLYAFLFITPSSLQEPDVYYFSFFELLIFVLIYTLPIYILVAVPFSFFIDKNAKTANLSFFKRSLCYSIAGFTTGFLFLVLMGGESAGALFFACFGLVNANLFHFFLTWLKKKKQPFSKSEAH